MPQKIAPINDRTLKAITAAWAALIMLLALAPRMSSLTDPTNPQGFNHGPLAHLAAFAILAALLFTLRNRSQTQFPVLQSVLIAGSYGILVELGQYLVPWRSFDPKDIAFNFAAACIGAITTRITKTMIINRLKN